MYNNEILLYSVQKNTVITGIEIREKGMPEDVDQISHRSSHLYIVFQFNIQRHDGAKQQSCKNIHGTVPKNMLTSAENIPSPKSCSDYLRKRKSVRLFVLF